MYKVLTGTILKLNVKKRIQQGIALYKARIHVMYSILCLIRNFENRFEKYKIAL